MIWMTLSGNMDIGLNMRCNNDKADIRPSWLGFNGAACRSRILEKVSKLHIPDIGADTMSVLSSSHSGDRGRTGVFTCWNMRALIMGMLWAKRAWRGLEGVTLDPDDFNNIMLAIKRKDSCPHEADCDAMFVRVSV